LGQLVPLDQLGPEEKEAEMVRQDHQDYEALMVL
jgi:hypothetical protein